MLLTTHYFLSPQFSTEDQMKKTASADFLIHVLTNDPERSEYFRQSLPKGIRTNFFFITDILKTSIFDMNADNNGAYLKSRNTNKFCYCDNDRSSIIREDISRKIVPKLWQKINTKTYPYIPPNTPHVFQVEMTWNSHFHVISACNICCLFLGKAFLFEKLW